jgi:myosin I
MAITKRAGKKNQAAATKAPPPKRGGVKKATFDVTKKKEVGVSDLTLLSKVSDEAINDNLKKRFDSGIIYVSVDYLQLVIYSN